MSAGVAVVILGWPVLGWALVVGGAASLIVFRDPDRECTAPPEVVCSPADGRVVEIGAVSGDLADRGMRERVGVATSLLDVHVTRAPIDARLVDLAHRSDRADRGRHTLSVWQSPPGSLAVRIRGRLAHRTVLDHAVGDTVRRSHRIGLAMLRPTVEVLLPASAEVLVRLGDRVLSGETPIARLRPADPS